MREQNVERCVLDQAGNVVGVEFEYHCGGWVGAVR